MSSHPRHNRVYHQRLFIESKQTCFRPTLDRASHSVYIHRFTLPIPKQQQILWVGSNFYVSGHHSHLCANQYKGHAEEHCWQKSGQSMSWLHIRDVLHCIFGIFDSQNWKVSIYNRSSRTHFRLFFVAIHVKDFQLSLQYITNGIPNGPTGH